MLAANAEFEQRQQKLLQEFNEQNSAERGGTFEIVEADEELAQVEQELQSHHTAESSALLAEIAELRSSLDKQNAELTRLRAQVSTAGVDENVVELMDAQRKQLEQYQRMQRDMDMCVMVMEQELDQTRQTLQRVVAKLRQQTERNQILSERLARTPTSH